MDGEGILGSEALVDQLHKVLEGIQSLRGDISDSRFDCLFPKDVMTMIKAIDHPLGIFSNDDEYFGYLKITQALWMEMNMVHSFGYKKSCNTADDRANILLTQLYEIIRLIKDYRTELSIAEYKNRLADYKTQEPFVYIPRVIRTCVRLEFTMKETCALEYIISSQAMALPNHISSVNFLSEHGTTGFTINYCGFTMQEGIEFFQEKRIHIQQGFVELETDYRTYLNNLLKTSPEILRALIGCKLTQNELLKIDNTVMALVLEEEPSFMDWPHLGEEDIREEDENEDENESENNSEEDETNALLSDAENIMQLISKQMKDAAPPPSNMTDTKSIDGDSEDLSESLTPYMSDIEYLEDQFLLHAAIMKKRYAEMDENKHRKSRFMDPMKEEAALRHEIREQKGMEKMLRVKCSRRLALTKKHSKWLPRLEILSERCKLTEFEKSVLVIVIGGIVSSEIRKVSDVDYISKFSEKVFEVGLLLWVLCPSLEEQMRGRSYFYKNGTLVKEGIIHINAASRWTRGAGDFMSGVIEIDRRMVDFLAGIDSEMNELVEGTNLYNPNVKLEKVILPQEQKDLIIKTVENYESFVACKKQLGFNSVTNYGNGIVLLFYGPSGTGKTMMANALAGHLGKRLLLINFGDLKDKTGDKLRFIFREANINDAVLFFDECESMFESRDLANGIQAATLTAIERHEGLIIMATNRAYDLDEAMYRRVTLSVEFTSPDPHLREEIWKTHLPENLVLADDVDLKELSINFELCGGFIKNAIAVALSSAVSRDTDKPIVNMNDLVSGAKLQLRGYMQMSNFDSRVVPSFTLEDVILPEKDMKTLNEIIAVEKSQKILFQHWGFEKKQHKTGVVVLFHGPSGCGKTTVAEAIGSEIGKPLLVVNVSALLSKNFHRVQSFQKAFTQAKTTGAILVFEECESLFSDQSNSLDSSVMLHHIQSFSGMVILMTRHADQLGKSFTNTFKRVLEFKIPGPTERSRLWRKLIPKQVPLADDVNFDQLANEFVLTGGNIKESIFAACSKAALANPDVHITHKQLQEAAKTESQFAVNLRSGPRSMFH